MAHTDTTSSPHGAASLKPAEATLLQGVCMPQDLRLVVRTKTRVDVGSWLGMRRVTAGCLDSSLVLWACGPRPYREYLAFSRLRNSLYNHVTGQLVLAPAEGLRVRGLSMPPDDAVRIMEYINRRNDSNA